MTDSPLGKVVVSVRARSLLRRAAGILPLEKIAGCGGICLQLTHGYLSTNTKIIKMKKRGEKSLLIGTKLGKNRKCGERK